MDTINDTRDGDSALDFLRRRFPALEVGERIEIRALDHKGGGVVRARGFFATPEEAAEFALGVAEGHEVYYGINPRLGEDGTKKGIARILCLWADLDYKKFGDSAEATRAALDTFPLEPTWIVATGGGLHAYWAIEPLEAAAYGPVVERLLRALYAALGNIDAVQNIDRIFRLPGSCNNKYEEPRRVRVVRHDPSARYTLHQFERALPALPPPDATERGETVPTEPGEMSVEEVESLLAHIPPTLPYNEYLAVWMAVHSVFPGDDGRDIVDRWSSDAREANGQTCSPRTRPGKHRGFRRSGEQGAIGARTLYWYAEQHGWRRPVPGIVRRDTIGRDAAQPAAWEPPIPLATPALPPFPLAALPPVLRDFVSALADATQTPPDLGALMCLAATSVAAQGTAKVELRPDWREPLNQYAAVVLPSGERKSPLLREVSGPLEEWERQKASDEAPAVAERRSRRKRLELQLSKAERNGDDAEADRLARALATTPEIFDLQLLADNATPEALTTLLHQQGGRMGVLTAEGTPFQLMAGRYAQNGEVNLEVYLQAHSGDTIRVDRRARKEVIREPALTMGLLVQPDVLRAIGQRREMRGLGLAARFAYALPASLIGRRALSPPPVPPRARDAYARVIRRLLALPLPRPGEAVPVLVLDAHAAAAFLAFRRANEADLRPFARLGDLTDWGGKLPGLVARFAGLLHMARHADAVAPWDEPIDRATMFAAIAIGEYLIPHALAAFDLMGADEGLADARHLLRWLEGRGGEALAEQAIWQATKARFREAWRLRRALDVLIEHGYLRPLPVETGAGGRPRRPDYALHPLLTNGHPNTPTTVAEDPADRPCRGSRVGFDDVEEQLEGGEV